MGYLLPLWNTKTKNTCNCNIQLYMTKMLLQSDLTQVLSSKSIVQSVRFNSQELLSANFIYFIFCANSATFISISFTYSINKSYGIYLESVNGLAGSNENHTYWELLSKKGKTIIRLNVGKCMSVIIQHALICHSPKMCANTMEQESNFFNSIIILVSFYLQHKIYKIFSSSIFFFRNWLLPTQEK